MSGIEFCENPGILRVFLILRTTINIICVVLPVLIVIITTISIGKTVINGEDDFKKEIPMVIKRLIAALIVFMIPSITKTVFSLTGDDLSAVNTCNNNATKERIKYFELVTPAKRAVDDLEKNPTKYTLAKAQEAVAQIASQGEEDLVISLLTRISVAENKINADEIRNECVKKGGKYVNGYCYEHTTDNNNNNNNNNTNDQNITFSGEDLSTGMTLISVGGQNYKAINTPIDVASFSNQMIRRGVRQNYNSEIYGGACLGFSYTHAWGLYKGNTNYSAEDGKNYVGAGNFSTYVNDNEQVLLGVVYQQLTQNKPVIIQVNGNKAGTSRHFVTVVGFKDTVKSANDIKATDLLIIDSWDGKLETMDAQNSRFLTTGAQCGKKDYSGYRIQYLK